MITIYKYTSPSNKCYIGQTSKTQHGRAGEGGSQYERCPVFWRAIQKYGWDNFTYEVLETVSTPEKANEKEVYYISLYQSNNPEYGYNIRPGGQGNGNYEYLKRLEDMKQMWENGSTAGEIRKKYNLLPQTFSYEMIKLGISGKDRISRSAGQYASKQTYQYNLKYELINVFKSTGEAEKQTGILNIRRSCAKNEGLKKPKYKSGGYYWTYYELDNPGKIF